MGSIYTLSKPIKIIRDDGLILAANKQTIKHPRFTLFDPAKHGPNGEKMAEAYKRKMTISEMESSLDDSELLSDAPRRPKAPKPAEGLSLGESCEDVELPVNALAEVDTKKPRGRPATTRE